MSDTISTTLKGPDGRYDEIAAKILQDTQASGVVLLVFKGNLGNGFSVCSTADMRTQIPSILRYMASVIEARIQESKLN